MNKKNISLIGAHLSIAQGLDHAIREARSIDATACQIFVKNGRSWKSKPLEQSVIDAFDAEMKAGDPVLMVAHASYLINIASTDADVRKKSIEALIDELTRCDKLSIPYLVLHPGSHLGAGIEAGCKVVAESINYIFEKYTFKTLLLLETAAGQGTNLGSTFEELHQMLSHITCVSKVGICFDTCHVNAAGYALNPTMAYQETMERFDAIIGFKHLKVMHLNNSKTEQGSKKDRHEKLLKGTMSKLVFHDIMHDARLVNVPKILETPIEKEYLSEYAEEIAWLRSL